MKLFLDTANLNEIQEIASWGVLDGVTTNPTLLSKEGPVDPEKHLKKICEMVHGPVSMEVIATDVKGMMKEARQYAKWAKNIVVKFPIGPEGLKAVQEARKEGIKSNVTLIFSANQALLAAKAGANIVSPFIGRLDEAGLEGMAVVAEIMSIFKNYPFSTELLVGSCRHPRHVTEAAMLGADIVTLPYEIFVKLVKHPFTDAGLAKFLADWEHRKKK